MEEFDDSTTLVFYLYKGQYAAIDIIPENDVSFEVQFLGGDTRMQNMILLADDEKVVEVQEMCIRDRCNIERREGTPES